MHKCELLHPLKVTFSKAFKIPSKDTKIERIKRISPPVKSSNINYKALRLMDLQRTDVTELPYRFELYTTKKQLELKINEGL